MRTFPITFLVIVFIGCKQATKRIIDRYPNGQTMTEYIYQVKSDTSNYLCKVYYENGQLKHETTISNNKFVGEKKSFHENGNLERIEKLYQPTPLNAEIYDCYIINYRTDGSKESEYQYRKDKLNGLAIDYDSTGRKARTAEYVDGKMNGKEIIYYPNGIMKSIVECRNDSAYGYEYEFNEVGDTLTANIHYGKSDNGVFYKKWLTNGRLLTGSYGDSNRSIVIWKWYDRKRTFIKSVTDKGVLVDSITNKFIAPE
jgi:antitoxin component YwqK of YwqJK toxin-antitoxin module